MSIHTMKKLGESYQFLYLGFIVEGVLTAETSTTYVFDAAALKDEKTGENVEMPLPFVEIVKDMAEEL
ncbi:MULTISPECIES: hypothetical protein [unclassified Paenibacillus]|uniref:hypothetical protein n=1 Tax=unclassified Paenibacillus TaxID=185978 RepID=UPI00277FF787|nr:MULTISPECIES: hypothetical protein [unclassified Paenibacillus]MDQ0896233.1 hypothetical protein [Paenibacillus sp. V4I7]MDQ0913952.1 hypothetical protein [Paenibacillus sp. V4I5]